MNETAFESWIWCIGLVTRVLLCDVVLYVCVVVYVSVITGINLFFFSEGACITIVIAASEMLYRVEQKG